MSKALYRKYRSKTLDEIVGQKHVTDLLARAIQQGRVSHAYLLTGPRGVGKTSIARILAHEINGLVYDEDAIHLDIIEIDAASNNGVEDVRDLREKVQIAPVSAKRKIYIIDEVHMLTKPAFNALLKTLEEPPEHVIFILATTDVDKIPATIISRTQRFSFRSITVEDAVKHLRHIANTEKIVASDDALRLIAERGDGSFRDSISLLDQLGSLADKKTGITTELIESSLGLAPHTTITRILDAVSARDIKEVITTLNESYDLGIAGTVLAGQLMTKIRDTLIEKPERIQLLDSLLDVSKSSHPNLKLLSILGIATVPKQSVKSVALLSPVPEVKATIAALEKQATQELVHTELENEPVAAVISSGLPAPSSVKKLDNKTGEFDWPKLIEHTRTKYVAIYSVLSKCHYVFEGKELTIYAGNKFYKKKLDDAKYNALIHECIKDSLGFKLDIHIIPTAPPPRDSQAAAVAVIMGGGEEVIVEDNGN